MNEFQIVPIAQIVESATNPRRRGELISSIREAIEQIGAGVGFRLADILCRLPEDYGSRAQAIASMILKMSQKQMLRVELRARGARRSSIYAWPGSWPEEPSDELAQAASSTAAPKPSQDQVALKLR